MNNREFAAMAVRMAEGEKTLYVNGCYAKRLTGAQKKYYIDHYSYNRGLIRKAKISAASDDTVGADCICFLKAIVDGWDPEAKDDACGVKYDPAHDLTEKGLLDACGKTVSSDFSEISVGEYLYNPGHGGVYIGDGLAVECTPSWKDGVQITAVHNIAKRSDYEGRKWEKHGKLPWIDYSREYTAASAPVLARGAVGEDVKKLQVLLNAEGESLDIDGSFGPATDAAVRAFQKGHRLETDGSVGPLTWGAILCG